MTENNKNNITYRVAIIGSGPAGFYTADHLFRKKDLSIEVDMFDRLPTPHGLVRSGVAPDHHKIKTVTKVYDKIASNPGFRFFGLVEFGNHIDLKDLMNHYHKIVFATGAQTDRRMNIPGEDVRGSHTATEFVAWYNGHPDYEELEFDLSCESVAVVGAGNVAVDVARILCRTVNELEQTDIAHYALEALKNSKVKNVYMLARRGPAQAAFTNPEIRELGKLEDSNVIVKPEEMELDDYTQEWLEETDDNSTRKKIEILKEYATTPPDKDKSHNLHIRFLVSPTEILEDESRQMRAVRVVKNELYKTDSGALRPKPTEQFEEIPCGLIFRSIGYQGVPLPEVPFHDQWGVIHNEKGRVIHPDTKEHIVGLYTTGWIKRGPSGVIGTNKKDSSETVDCIVEDIEAGKHLKPAHPHPDAIHKLVKERQPQYISYQDWLRLDQMEIERGKKLGRPRVKFTNVKEMLEALRNN